MDLDMVNLTVSPKMHVNLVFSLTCTYVHQLMTNRSLAQSADQSEMANFLEGKKFSKREGGKKSYMDRTCLPPIPTCLGITQCTYIIEAAIHTVRHMQGKQMVRKISLAYCLQC